MAEGKNLQIKRGTVATIGTLMAGEPGWATDTEILYVGNGAANKAVLMASQASAAGLALLDDASATVQIATLGLDADIATLALPANTTISAAGAELINDADAAAQLATLGTAAYSEGTWTPVLTGFTIVGSAPIALGVYRRIGNLMSIACTILAGDFGNTSVAAANPTSVITGFIGPAGAVPSTCNVGKINGVPVGIGMIVTTNLYVPSWSASTVYIAISATYIVA